MELLSKDEINHLVKQLGFTKALKWSLNNFSDSIIGYLSEHLTLTVEVESGSSKIELKFFVKCIPRFNVNKAKFLKETMFFSKEYAMLNSLFKHFGEGSQKWRPSLLLDKENLFIFEDITQLGYKMSNNGDALSLDQVQACVETIARFHAQSYIYEEKKSEELGRPYRIWEDYSDYLQVPVKGRNWRNVGRNAVIEFLKVYSKDRNDSNFIVNLEEAITELYERALCLMKPHPVDRNVVVHSDLWSNNVLFKYNDGKYHALIVDFQTVRYSSPMMDLSTFIYFNTTRQFRDNYLQEVIDLYHGVLTKELKDCNIDVNRIVDRDSLEQCYKESIEFSISYAAILLPITLMDAKMKEQIFSDPETAFRFNEVSRSAEFIEVAKHDENFFVRVSELFDEIAERYVYTNISIKT